MAILLRLMSALVWCVVWVSLFWFYEYTDNATHVFGFLSLLSGFVVTLFPKSAFKQKHWDWLYLGYIFMAGIYFLVSSSV